MASLSCVFMNKFCLAVVVLGLSVAAAGVIGPKQSRDVFLAAGLFSAYLGATVFGLRNRGDDY